MDTEQRTPDTLSGREWLKDRARDWLKYYWPCLLLAITALGFYGLVLHHQARKSSDEAQYQIWATQEAVWGEDKAMLSIAYPGELRLESPGEPRPISVWLWRATPTLGPTSTPTITPTPTLVHTGTLPPTPTPTCTPRPWIVAFSPHDEGVLFTDREGMPIAPQAALTPGAESAAPAVLYAQRAPLATEVPATTLNVSVYGPDTAPVLTQPLTLSVALESVEDAQRRHRQDLLCGPTTPLLALAVSLVTFAAREWRRRSEQAREERKRRILAKVERLAYLKSRPMELVLQYWELQERTKSEPDWNDPEVIQRLDKVLKDTRLEALLEVIGKWFGESEDEEAIRCTQMTLNRDGENKIAQAFDRALKYAQASRETTVRLLEEKAEEIASALTQISTECGDAGKARAARLLTDLGKRQGWDRKTVESFEVSREHLRWLDLWPSVPPADPKTVTDWLRTIGLAFNPFGPEAAELDPRLRTYEVSTVFEHIRGKRPVFVFGKAGSGRTAAALLLAFYCEDPPGAPREAGAFPVYCALPTVASLSAAQDHRLLTVTHATAQSVARYLAHRPEDFFKLPESRKHGTARLLCLWAGSRELLEGRLRHAGPAWGISSRLVREVTAMYQEVSYDQEVSCDKCLRNFPDLLADALPRRFECMYLVLDLSTIPTKPRIMAEKARNLQQLLDLTIPLAARGVYLKLFLPDVLRPHLGDLSAYEVVTLTWSPDNLADMLEARIRAATGSSLAALCGSDVPTEPSPDVRLVKAANGSPRQLVRLGNELLKTHAQRAPEEPTLSAEEIDNVLGPLDKASPDMKSVAR